MANYYVVHIATRDGDKEYLETTIMCLPDFPSKWSYRTCVKAIIEEYTSDTISSEEGSEWYKVESCYRHYRCEQIQKVKDEHVEILRQYI
jgi:hypothetical protein